MSLILNFVAFQVGWFSAVLGAAYGLPWAGAGVIGVIILLHLLTVRRPTAELTLILLCGLIGAVLDSALVAAGWVGYPSGMLVSNAAPYWIVAMWMLFATTLNVSLKWLRERKSIAVVFGLIGGPLAYYTGYRLGGIEFNQPLAAMVALGIGWALVMPLLLALAERYDGVVDGRDARRGPILD